MHIVINIKINKIIYLKTRIQIKYTKIYTKYTFSSKIIYFIALNTQLKRKIVLQKFNFLFI